MSMLQQLMVKPWTANQGTVDDLYAGGASSRLAKKLALRVFLAVVAVLFTLLVTAYGGRMVYEDWRPAPQVNLLWANTLVLILSSVALQWAQYSVRRGRMDAMRVGLLAAGAFTVVFLFGQVLAWRQLATMVYFEVTNPAIAFFYLITGLHGMHLVGGLVAWAGPSPKCGAILTWRRSGRAWSCVPFTGTSCCWFGWSSLACCSPGIIWTFY